MSTGELPEKSHTFTIDVEGSLTKTKYVGEFTAHIPTQKEMALIAKHRAFLNGDLAEYLDSHTLGLHTMIAYLRFCLDDYPNFWKKSDLGYDLYDFNVIEEIYTKVTDFEVSWLTEVWGEDYLKGKEANKKE